MFANLLLEYTISAIRYNLRAELRAQASQQVVDLALVARAMQARTGELPESLADLEPFVEKSTLIQPSTGDPIGFRADETGIVIYHWHTNRQDDGGDLDESQDDWGIRIKKSSRVPRREPGEK